MCRVVIDFDEHGRAVNQLSLAPNRWSIRANEQAGTMARDEGQAGWKLKSLYAIITTKFSQTCIVAGAVRVLMRDVLR